MNLITIETALISEKAHKLMEKGVYTFMVDETAGKHQIKNAVEKQFGVKVEKVNISRKSAKGKRIAKSRKTVLVGGGKKAIVFVAAGQRISILNPTTEKKKESTSKPVTKKVEKSSSESKGLLSKIKKPKEERKEEVK